MLKRGLQILLFIILCQCFVFKILAQTKINNCLNLGQKDRYLLTEKIKQENGHYQAFNSLFIWDKDKIIRIIFLYDRRLSLVPNSVTTRLKSFESFLPTFKKCVWHENIKRQTYGGIYIYDQTFADKGTDEASGAEYESKLKIVINARNKSHNPLADKFGSISVSDGDREVMIYNDKRKSKEINNLPLLFNSEKGDSSYVISPIHIDIYKASHSEKNENSISEEFTGYKLYASISFLKQSVTYPTGEQNNESYKFKLADVIGECYLPYLYRTNSIVDTSLFIKKLLELPLSSQKTYSNDAIVSKTKSEFLVKSRKDSINRQTYLLTQKEDSIKSRENIKSKFFKGLNFDYQFCAECYDLEISKKERINRHCPFKFGLYRNESDENWSYAFYVNNSYYFKVRGYDMHAVRDIGDQDEHSQKWFLMSPGIGFWMSDVRINNNRYSINDASLFLNGKKISDN